MRKRDDYYFHIVPEFFDCYWVSKNLTVFLPRCSIPLMTAEVEQRPVLEEAIDTFMDLLPDMLKEHEGQWVVIKDGERPLGFARSQMRIYKKGLKEYGTVPFLVRQISREYLEFGRYGKPILVTRNLEV